MQKRLTELSDAQKRALKKVTSKPQTKDQIGVGGGTLRALVKKRYIKTKQVMEYESAVLFWK